MTGIRRNTVNYEKSIPAALYRHGKSIKELNSIKYKKVDGVDTEERYRENYIDTYRKSIKPLIDSYIGTIPEGTDSFNDAVEMIRKSLQVSGEHARKISQGYTPVPYYDKEDSKWKFTYE